MKYQTYYFRQKALKKEKELKKELLFCLIISLLIVIPAITIKVKADNQSIVIQAPIQLDGQAYTNDQIQKAYKQQIKKAYITKYTLQETGFNDGIMASGKKVYVGAVAVSDRTISLGSKITIDNKQYTVEDRTAQWIHNRQGLTVDIFSNNYQEALKFGKQLKTVIIE